MGWLRHLLVRTRKRGVHLMQRRLVLRAQVARAEHDVHALNRAGERERWLVGVRDRGARIRSHTERVDAEAARHRVLDARTADFLAIDPDDGFASLAESAPVIRAFDPHRSLPRATPHAPDQPR